MSFTRSYELYDSEPVAVLSRDDSKEIILPTQYADVPELKIIDEHYMSTDQCEGVVEGIRLKERSFVLSDVDEAILQAHKHACQQNQKEMCVRKTRRVKLRSLSSGASIAVEDLGLWLGRCETPGDILRLEYDAHKDQRGGRASQHLGVVLVDNARRLGTQWILILGDAHPIQPEQDVRYRDGVYVRSQATTLTGKGEPISFGNGDYLATTVMKFYSTVDSVRQQNGMFDSRAAAEAAVVTTQRGALGAKEHQRALDLANLDMTNRSIIAKNKAKEAVRNTNLTAAKNLGAVALAVTALTKLAT